MLLLSKQIVTIWLLVLVDTSNFIVLRFTTSRKKILDLDPMLLKLRSPYHLEASS